MAGGRPMNRLHQDDVRAKIQVGQLLKTLSDQALGTSEKELSPVRLKAIEILLRKSLPDLNAVTISGDMNVTVSLIESLRNARGNAG